MTAPPNPLAAPLAVKTDHLAAILADAVVDDPGAGRYQVSRQALTDPDIFELEMKYIFEGNWVYLAHESQIPNPGDYFTTYIGRSPVAITRDRDGQLHCLINACSHRGAMICRRKTDNRLTFTCPFHGWTFRNDGTLLKVKLPEGAGYPESFNENGQHNMTKVARFDSYRGFLFGSLNADVLPLAEHLSGMTALIDMFVDQAPEGLEVLRGSSTYTFDGNWKLQTENGSDGYHVTSVHWNYAATTGRRSTGESSMDVKVIDAAATWSGDAGGYWAFPNGHICLWSKIGNPTDIARYTVTGLERLKKELGDKTGAFVLNYTRNNGIYPNVYLMDQLSSQIRHYRPISPDLTAVTIYCIAPKGEDPERRALRIRQYEDFFNASGMATADDLEEFRGVQLSARAWAAPWNDISRGATHWVSGPGPLAESLEVEIPGIVSAGIKTEDEGLFVVQHSYWLEIMRKALAKEQAAGNGKGNRS